jgi:hypothetical protein
MQMLEVLARLLWVHHTGHEPRRAQTPKRPNVSSQYDNYQ